MLVFDASSMIYAWDNYPIDQFPALWEWLGDEIRATRVCFPQVAFEEVNRGSVECGNWLTAVGVGLLPVTRDVLNESLRIKALLGIGDKYGSGVGENDLFIISTAKLAGAALVSDEGLQPILPKTLANCKIPAVCSQPSVAVECFPFVTYMKRSGRVFR